MTPAEWLRGYLMDMEGEAPSNSVYAEAANAGYSLDAIKRAKRQIGAVSAHPSITSPWLIRLSPDDAETLRLATSCGACGRQRELTDGYCNTCRQVRSRAKGWGPVW